MKILITGATGYIGSNLVKSLVLNSNYIVSVIVRLSSSLLPLSDVTDKIKIYYFDGSAKSMLNIVSESSPDIVCHLAGVSNYNHTHADINNIINSNILFGTLLLDSMANNNIKKY